MRLRLGRLLRRFGFNKSIVTKSKHFPNRNVSHPVRERAWVIINHPERTILIPKVNQGKAVHRVGVRSGCGRFSFVAVGCLLAAIAWRIVRIREENRLVALPDIGDHGIIYQSDRGHRMSIGIIPIPAVGSHGVIRDSPECQRDRETVQQFQHLDFFRASLHLNLFTDLQRVCFRKQSFHIFFLQLRPVVFGIPFAVIWILTGHKYRDRSIH